MRVWTGQEDQVDATNLVHCKARENHMIQLPVSGSIFFLAFV